jgi:hypothetical protein
MTGGVFLIGDDKKLVELASAPYDSEALLQELLVRYPNLLAGNQIDPAVPRRWLLITREAAVPAEIDGSGRWSLDHLFLDQDGIPTLVEVKRSNDTRIRREVIGQMLDYAANGVAYWPVETVRSMFEARHQRDGTDPNETLATFLGPEASAETLWQQVKTNLQAGRIRMIFVADEIPPELRRVVEFLNTQMDPAEVLAVEVKQYIGGSFRGLVPRVLGQTEQGMQKKSAGGGPVTEERTWDEGSLLAELERRFGAVEVNVARRILQWARSTGHPLWSGKGTQSGSVYVDVGQPRQPVYPFAIWTYGKIEVQLQSLTRVPPFDSESSRRELQRRLNAIPGIAIADESFTKRPSFSLALLNEDATLNQFIGAVEWTETAVREAVKMPAPGGQQP